jgi:hypothetical protein
MDELCIENIWHATKALIEWLYVLMRQRKGCTMPHIDSSRRVAVSPVSTCVKTAWPTL